MTHELTRVPRAATLLAAPATLSKHDTPEEEHVNKRNALYTLGAAAAAALLAACGGTTSPQGDVNATPANAPTVITVPQSPGEALGTAAAPSIAGAVASPAPAASVKTVATFGDGMWQVPEEVKPGTYKTVVPADSWNCYYEVKKNFDDEMGSILSNGNMSAGKQVIISIPKTAKGVEVSGCGTWVKIK